MILKFETILKDGKTREPNIDESYFLAKEILRSCNSEVIAIGKTNNDIIEIKLTLNGIEVEPKLLGRILKEVNNYIDKEALLLVKEKITDLEIYF